MGKKERRAYLDAIRKRYAKADRVGKGRILDEFCAVCEFHRKHAIRLLGHSGPRPGKRAGRPPRYADPALLSVLRRIWLACDQMCSKRLKAALPLWLPHYETSYGRLPEPLKARLLALSAATIDRLLKPLRARLGRRGLTGTKPGTLLKTQIPLRTNHWDITRPGFLEADTVAHCGNSLAGSFVWSITLTDICTGWTECRAVWNKGAHGVVEQIRRVEAALPFKLRGFDCDNGSEFLNHHLLRYFAHRRDPVAFTRSRPYHKDDNAHVEQKNWSCVRQLLGYDRLEHPHHVRLINNLYANEWSLYINHFCPSMKLKAKQRDGAKTKRQYHPPQTPLQRLLATRELTKPAKTALRDLHAQLNPFTLKATIETKLRRIFNSVSVTSNLRQRI
jgi:hypothetical protein